MHVSGEQALPHSSRAKAHATDAGMLQADVADGAVIMGSKLRKEFPGNCGA